MSPNQTLGDLIKHTRTYSKYSIHFGSHRRPLIASSGHAQIRIDTETKILNKVLITEGEPPISQRSAISYTYYDREVSPDILELISAKFQLAMSAYLKRLKKDEDYKAAFLAAKEAIGGI